MVLSAEIRKERIQHIRETATEIGLQRLFYQGANKDFKVFRIDLDLLIYNRHNGRIEAEMLTWELENQEFDEYDENLDTLIGGLLWQSSVGRNESTLADLERKSQQRPAIVTLDGVIIDGNRRAMLLRRLAADSGHAYLNAIVLDDAYADNEQEIVRLETQYQIGEDAKVEYGALQKYLHTKRLHRQLGIDLHEIDGLMNRDEGYARKLLQIMDLMDRYLEHIGCSGLYTMLKDDSDGTKEGMFVDLHNDLARLRAGGSRVGVDWPFGEADQNDLEAIQFDFIRLGSLEAGNKQYRQISHQGKKKNFFSHEDIWNSFSEEHHRAVDPATMELPPLEEFIVDNPHHASKSKAARAREKVWCLAAESAMNRNFAANQESLAYRVQHLEPRAYLEKALRALGQIPPEAAGLTADPLNAGLLDQIASLVDDMQDQFGMSGLQ